MEVDFFDIKKNEIIRLEKENEIKDKELNKKLLIDKINNEKEKKIKLEALKIADLISIESFDIHLTNITNSITEYTNRLKNI